MILKETIKIADSHCDTLSKLVKNKAELLHNNEHLDLKRVLKYKNFMQLMAVFAEPLYHPGNILNRVMHILDNAFLEFDKYKEYVNLCLSYDDILSTHKYGKIAVMLSIEGGDALMGDIALLRLFYRLGVRSLCLTWNNRNEISDGIAEEESKSGLTAFGRHVVKEMNRLGMLIDVSHISEKGFWDCLELSSAPVIASHSNSKQLCAHRRNLTDEQIISLANKGGIIGVNFYPLFLSDSGTAGISEIIRHIEHICEVGGTDCICFGGDLDGIQALPTDYNGVDDYYAMIYNELLKMNYSNELLEKISHLNLLRIISEVIR